MTVERRYTCNYCKADLRDGGVGIHFIGNASARLAPVKDVENHFCDGCAAGLKQALEDYEYKPRPK